MSKWKSQGARNWVLGAAATGLLCQSLPAFGQSRNLTFFSKKNAASKPVPAPTVEPPRLLAVPDGSPAAPDAIQPISQTVVAAGDKSEVQKQLEALYEKDGREMPPMITSVQPISPIPSPPQQGTTNTPAPRGTTANPSTQNSIRPGQGYTQYSPRPQATPYSLQAPTQTPKVNSPAPRNYSAVFDAQSNPQLPVQQQVQQPQPVQQVQQVAVQPQMAVQPQLQPQPQGQQPPIPPPSKNPVVRFFKKIGISNRLTSQPPIPPDYNSTVPGVPPVSASGIAVTPPAQVPLATANGSPAIPALSSLPELPPPLVAMPPLAQQAVPVTVAAGAVAAPELKVEPQAPVATAAPEPAAQKATTVVTVPINDFPNPFTEVTEAEADKKIIVAPKATVAIEAVKVAPETQPAAASVPQVAVKPEVAVKSEIAQKPEVAQKIEDDPFAVPAKDFSEPVIDESVGTGSAAKTATAETLRKVMPNPGSFSPPALTAPSGEDAKPAVEPIPSALAPSFDTGGLVPPETTPDVKGPDPDPHLEKMRKIRGRFGMKGLKGFCPVTLHDERELVDARPEFHFTHRTQKFHFASAEARDKFEADSSRYAPAAYGADVVALSRDKDVVEGTLDFAAWFKGRLYLFGSQENYNAFVASPAKFATLTGIE